MTLDREAARARHWAKLMRDGRTVCGREQAIWPCDAAQALDALAAAEARIATLERHALDVHGGICSCSAEIERRSALEGVE